MSAAFAAAMGQHVAIIPVPLVKVVVQGLASLKAPILIIAAAAITFVPTVTPVSAALVRLPHVRARNAAPQPAQIPAIIHVPAHRIFVTTYARHMAPAGQSLMQTTVTVIFPFLTDVVATANAIVTYQFPDTAQHKQELRN